MMKVNMTSKALDRHLEFGYFKRDGRRRETLYECLNSHIEIVENVSIKEVLVFLCKNLRRLLIGSPYSLSLLIKDVEEKINRLNINREELNIVLDNIFGAEYDYFVSRAPGSKNLWCAYAYVRELDISVCPYCNSQFIFRFESDDGNGKTRPVLDHFFGKSSYPYLAISIQNLVPCCKVCNSDFKNTENMSYHKYIHPFEKGFGDDITFKKVLKDGGDQDHLSALLGEGFDFCLELDLTNTSKDLKEKAQNSIKLFHIEDIYNGFHKTYVQEIILKSRIYNEAYKSQLHSAFGKIFRSKEELHNILIPHEDSSNKTILSKLTKDILQNEISDN